MSVLLLKNIYLSTHSILLHNVQVINKHLKINLGYLKNTVKQQGHFIIWETNVKDLIFPYLKRRTKILFLIGS